MSTPLLICDDSSFARNQLARALPADWDVTITYARGGAEALEAIRAGKGRVLFLDLNMPDVDGYAVLETLRAEGLPTMTIVVSGDIQPEARARVMKLGALDFVKKPVAPELIADALKRSGIHTPAQPGTRHVEAKLDVYDSYREIANVAMGRAADLLARLLGVFVQMPVPKVNTMDSGEFSMVLDHIENDNDLATVCQGFIGSGIAGEALLMFDRSSFVDIAVLLRHEGEIDEGVRGELLTDIAGIVIGACLKGIADQLDLSLSQSHPVLLRKRSGKKSTVARRAATPAIELACGIEGRNIHCNLLLLFTEESLAVLDQRIRILAG